MIRLIDSRITSILLVAASVGGLMCARPNDGNSQSAAQSAAQQCLAPDRSQPAVTQVDSLLGQFELELHETADLERDSVIRGRVTLARQLEDASRGEDLYGWTTISVEQVGDISITTPLSSKDPRQPGILGFAGNGDSPIVLLFGSASKIGNVSRHTGLLLQVFTTEAGGFRGAWVAATVHRPRPEGFFCAWRIQ